jgi:hypothetical protein
VAADDAVFYLPIIRQAAPTGQILAIEKADKALGISTFCKDDVSAVWIRENRRFRSVLVETETG